MAYGPDSYSENEIRVDQIGQYRDSWPMVWIHVEGLGDESALRELGRIFGVHRLALEDVVNLGQRAKAESYDEDLFIVVRIPNEEVGSSEQVTLLVGSVQSTISRSYRRSGRSEP